VVRSGRGGGRRKKMVLNTSQSFEDKKILIIIAPKDFRDEEFLKPVNVFKDLNINLTIASRGVKKAVGMFGTEADVDKDLTDVKVDDFHAIVFVGGSGASEYFNDPNALLIAKEAFDKGKVISAICIAPVILGNANVLKGKEATVWSSLTDKKYVKKIKEKGAIYVNGDVVQDGKIITANGPSAAEKFAKKIIENLK
jgi:protease I